MVHFVDIFYPDRVFPCANETKMAENVTKILQINSNND